MAPAVLQKFTIYPSNSRLDGRAAGEMAIMACNTSSALALETVRDEYDLPILGVIFAWS